MTKLWLTGTPPVDWSRPFENYRWLDFLIVASLPVVLYFPLTSAWWLNDDPAILRHIVEFGVLSNFYVPDNWRSYSPVNFTPLLIASIALDLELFGLAPFGYYLHQLLGLGLSAALGFYVLLGAMKRWVALLVTTLVVLSPSVSEIAGSLMMRHYLDGSLLALVSLILFRLSLKRCSVVFCWASALFYLGAGLAKEIYVLLPLFGLAFLGRSSVSDSLRALTAFCIAGLVYGVWRLYMLGWFGAAMGYGDLFSFPSDSVFAGGTRYIWQTLAYGNYWFSCGLSVAAGVGVIVIIRKRQFYGLVIVAASAVGAWAPIAFLLPNLSDRYLLIPTIWIFTLAGVGLSAISRFLRRRHFLPRALPLVTVLLATFVPVRDLGQAFDIRLRLRAAEEGLFTWNADAAMVLADPIGPPWYHRSLGWLRFRLGDGEASPSVCYDLCACDLKEFNGVFAFNDKEGELKRIAVDLTKCRPTVPRSMSVSVRYVKEHGILTWQLGPKREGRWFTSQAPEFFAREVPAEGKIPFHYQRPIKMRFLFVADKGWSVESPELTLGGEIRTEAAAVEINWQR